MGVDTQLKIVEVLKNIPAGSSLQDYKEYLCPLIAKNKQEQFEFNTKFPAIAKLILEDETNPKKETPSLVKEKNKRLALPPNKGNYRGLGALLTFLFAGFIYWGYMQLFYVSGCTDPRSATYNPNATIDDGSCSYSRPLISKTYILGCMDPRAINFNPLATKACMGCCSYKGCVDSLALNFNPKAKIACADCCELLETTNTIDGIIGLSQRDITTYKVHFPFQNVEIPVINRVNEGLYALYQLKHILTYILLGIIMAILISVILYRRAYKRFLTIKEPGNAPPYQFPLLVQPTKAISFGPAFNKVINKLAARKVVPGQKLNFEKTIHSTIKNGGAIDLKRMYDRQPNSYLILIDKKNNSNHQSQLFEVLHQKIVEQNVKVERYFFDSQPRVCWNENFPNGIRLEQIFQRHFYSRLLIFSDGYSFINPMTGEVEDWLWSLKRWSKRGVLTPVPTASWTYREALLSDEFTVFPNSIDGISQLLNHFEEEKNLGLAQRMRLSAEEVPVISLNENNWHAELNRVYSLSMQKWIALCAIYPELHWGLTLKLGHILQEKNKATLITYENIRSLSQLEWFRKGKIPDFFREKLMVLLTANEKQNAREIIIEILELNTPKSITSFAYQDHQFQLSIHQMLIAQAREEQNKWKGLYREQYSKGFREDTLSLKAIDHRF